MKYNDIIGVNENFQYSVNLQFDITNISKIKEYIPTKDGCELLKKYLQSVYCGKNRATTLIGPYGKGKSHLLLVLITLLNDSVAFLTIFSISATALSASPVILIDHPEAASAKLPSIPAVLLISLILFK